MVFFLINKRQSKNTHKRKQWQFSFFRKLIDGICANDRLKRAFSKACLHPSNENLIHLYKIQTNYPIMPDFNKLKVFLVEKKKIEKWLANQLWKLTCTVSKWFCNTVQPNLKTLSLITPYN